VPGKASLAMLRRTWYRRLARSNRLIADAQQRIEIQKELISQLEHGQSFCAAKARGHPGEGAAVPVACVTLASDSVWPGNHVRPGATG
jgi:hypothetical protein